MTTPEPLPLLLRRSKAREITGLADQAFTKVVEARVLEPVYLVWEVTDHKGRVLFSTNETKARDYIAQNPGTKSQPAGQAYFRSADVQALANGKTP